MKSVIICILILTVYPLCFVSAEIQSLKVKDFYVGMGFEDSKKNAKRLFKSIDNNLKIEEISLGTLGKFIYGVKPEDKRYSDFQMCSIRVAKNEKGKLKSVEISGQLIDILFNVRGMDIKTFITEFQKSYDTPQFIPTTVEETNGMWKERKTKYKSLNEQAGCVVWISEDKSLKIEYVNKKSEAKFD